MPFNHFDFISPIYDRFGRFDRAHPLLELLEFPPGGQSFSEALRGMPRVQRAGTQDEQSFSEALRGMPRVQRAGTQDEQSFSEALRGMPRVQRAGTQDEQSFSEALRGMPRVQRAGTQDELIILDIGGGTGRIAQELTGDDRHVVVIDLSTGMLKKVYGKPGLSPLLADAAALPFQTGSVQRVLIVDALHHIKRQPESIHELCRLLEPGGVGVVVEPDTRVFLVKLIVLMEAILLMGSHFLKGDELLGLFKNETGGATLSAWRGNLLLQFRKK
jgi:SAM-dependent methyltransferase